MLPAMSMNRTAATWLCCLASLAGGTSVLGQNAPPPKQVQANLVTELVAKMVGAETALQSLRMTMATTGKLRGGLEIVTKGELRVLRETQKDQPQPASQRLFSQMQYAFGDGLKGRIDTAQTAEGIVIYEEDPAFGAVFLRIDASVVADLEWAAAVAKRSDLPGMPDARAQSPLGSGMVRDLQRTFDLVIGTERELAGEPGTWLRGARRAGLDAQDADLPLPDRVEVFVRDRDHALMLARFFVGEDIVQELKVESLEVGAKLEPRDFTVDGHGERIRNAKDYPPMWEQIEAALRSAEGKITDGAVRPSKRPAAGSGK